MRQDSCSSTSCCACFASNCTGLCSLTEPSPRTQSDWQEVHCLRWCSQTWARPPSKRDSSSGFHAAEWWLDTRSEPSQQRTLRQNGKSLLELCSQRAQPHASSHCMALATHMSLSLASHSTTAGNSVLMESLSLIKLVSGFLQSRNSPCSLVHVLSMATSCTVSCFKTHSRPHSIQTSPPSP